MIRNIRVDGADEADIVGHFAHVRKQFADLHPALTVLLEGEGRAQQRSGLALGGHDAARQRLAVILLQRRFRIEAIHLRKAAINVQKDDALGLGFMMQFGQRRREPSSLQ